MLIALEMFAVGV